jgi:cyclophilin family peptidyl-prolyl cis-trans isomerase
MFHRVVPHFVLQGGDPREPAVIDRITITGYSSGSR